MTLRLWLLISLAKHHQIHQLLHLHQATHQVPLRAWEYANNIRRQSPTVNAIKAILNLTDEQVDQIFIQAEQIDA